MTKVSIATKPLVYSTFRYIANTPWNALAEYIDNSLQSYLSHKDILSEINPNKKLSINIQIDGESIVITDNAWGIENENYQRAFELANIPLNASGLSEFGMGMKVSSIWFSDVWTVETCAYGEGVKKTVTFDINEVVEKQETSLNVIEERAGEKEHYTRITLTKLSQNRPKQIAAVKRHLTSTYISFIRDGILNLTINDELMEVKEPKILVAQYHKKVSGVIQKQGEPIEWKEKFEFAPVGSRYKVTGFIGVLETMSTDKDNGFLIFRRGRTIGYSGENKYRDKHLCGQVGSPQYKRIFGELHVEGFDVSFQKNAFQEDEAFSAFIEDLADYLKNKIRKGEMKDIFGQATDYLKDKTVADTKKTSKTLVQTLVSTLKSPVVDESGTESELSLFGESSVDEKILIANEPPQEIKEAARYEADTVLTIGGKKYKLTIKTEATGNKNGLYDLIKLPDGSYETIINLSNSFFDTFDGDEGELKKIVYFIRVLIYTEFAIIKGGAFRIAFNKYFGSI